jgi:CcmD family protein
MTYLFLAYAVFWGVTFALVFSIFVRQKATERELSSLRVLVEQDPEEQRMGDV